MNDTLAIDFIRRGFVLDDQWTGAADGLETYIGVIKVRSCRSIRYGEFIVKEMLGRYGPLTGEWCSV